jgi:hypothetical protein
LFEIEVVAIVLVDQVLAFPLVVVVVLLKSKVVVL